MVSPSPAWLASVLFAGCVVFDPALYQQSQGLTLADRCESITSIPVATPDPMRPVPVDTTSLADQYREFASCVGNDLPGNEGFFSVSMRRGETWHFHVDPVTSGADPAVYVLPVCTTLQCLQAGANDTCGAGRSEHFSFRPDHDGAHLIGIDSRLRGGAQYNVTIVRASCGDGVIMHGEPCDDAVTQSGVTCERCHKVLAQPMDSEAGVANDDYTNAMALRPAGGFMSFPVTGSIGGCDTDMFTFEAPDANRYFRVAVTERGGGACPAGTALSLWRTDAVAAPALPAPPELVNQAMVVMENGCPVLSVDALPRAGTYFFKITVNPEPAAEFRYQLSFDLGTT